MKMIVAILLASSISALANETGALSAVKKIFQLQENEGGVFFGVTPKNEECRVTAAFYEDHAVITAETGTTVVSRMIVDGSGYRFHEGRREFLSSDQEGTFRTLAVTATRTYTVTSAWRDGREFAVECVLH